MAFTMFGHGSEPFKQEFIVPPGCYILAKALPDQPITHDYFRTLMQPFRASPDIFLHPTEHRAELLDIYGPVSIYLPGQTCPNFVYSLGPEYMKRELFSAFFNLYHGAYHRTEFDLWVDATLGTVPVPFVPAKRDAKITTHPTRLKIQYMNEYLYADSIYPTAADVHRAFESEWGPELYPQLEYKDFLQGASQEENVAKLKRCLKQFEITQEKLCTMFPGAYYNLICRTLRIKSTSIPYWVQDKTNWVVNPNITSYTGAPANVKRVIGRVISEAELKRKNTARNRFQKAGSRKTKKRRRGRK